jgi:hypothetical protein
VTPLEVMILVFRRPGCRLRNLPADGECSSIPSAEVGGHGYRAYSGAPPYETAITQRAEC